jgi:hypothetical protein
LRVPGAESMWRDSGTRSMVMREVMPLPTSGACSWKARSMYSRISPSLSHSCDTGTGRVT